MNNSINRLENALIVFQATSLCNLNCRYCYVPDRLNKAQMDLDLFREAVTKIFKSKLFEKKIKFLWHSGEPLAVGLDYYKKAVEIVNCLCPSDMKCTFEIQTNATLITKEWVDFFKAHQFHVGVSIDGPAFLHDKNRRTWGNKPTHKKTLNGLRLIKEGGINFGIICVLTEESLDYPNEIFDFFYEEGVPSISFNLEEKDGDNTNSTVFDHPSVQDMLKKYRAFMEKIYERWEGVNRSIEFREIARIRKAVNRMLKDPSYFTLSQEIRPFAIISIARNGDISLFSPELIGGVPEDRRKFIVANIRDINFIEEISQLPKFHEIHDPIQQGLELCATTCQYFGLCGGGSPSNKYAENGTFASSETKYCNFQQKLLTDIYIEKMSNK